RRQADPPLLPRLHPRRPLPGAQRAPPSRTQPLSDPAHLLARAHHDLRRRRRSTPLLDSGGEGLVALVRNTAPARLPRRGQSSTSEAGTGIVWRSLGQRPSALLARADGAATGGEAPGSVDWSPRRIVRG